MPTRRSDAINVVDLIADAIKQAIGVDDNWYTLEVDWAIQKENPMVTIEISQTATENTHFCSACQTFKPYSQFHTANVTKVGIQGQCKDCNSRLGKEKWATKKEIHG